MVGGLSLGASGCGAVTEPCSVKVEAPYAGTVALACHQGHLAQNPSAGTLVAPGTAVNLSVGQRPMHPCP